MLNRLALRLATVRALRGRTLAGNNVLDSEQAAIDDVATEHPTPVILVYTDDGQFAHGGRNLYATSGDNRVSSGTQALVIEMVVTQRMIVPQLDANGDPVIGEDGNPVQSAQAVRLMTDASIEATLDIMEAQALAALQSGVSAWSDIWKRLASNIVERQSQRGASNRDGVRYAGRQLTLGVELPYDPPAGSPPGPLWADFLALAAQDPSLVPLLPMVQAVFDAPAPETQEEETRAFLGRHSLEVRALMGERIAVPEPPPEEAP